MVRSTVARQSPKPQPTPSHDPTLTPPLFPLTAHEEHKSADEIAKFKALQESAYHCAPVIAAQLATRKRAAQQALGIAENTEAASRFLNAFEHAQDTGAPILGCSPLEEARIRNHT